MQRTRLLVAGLFVLAAACSGTDTTTSAGDDAIITADAATTAADGVAEDVDMMAGMDGLTGNISGDLTQDYLSGPGGFRPHLTGCSFANGSFTCPSTLRNGLSVTRTITFLDADGQAQAAYDSLLTASIHVVADISGDVTHGPWSATVTRHREFTITGLAGTETTRTANGNGNESVTRSRVARNDSVRTYDITGTSVITNVVFPVRTADGGNGWPLSGTITRTLNITVTSGPHTGETRTRTVTITFNGTSSVDATVDGTTFTVDLGQHTATRHG